ncbi:polymer-forming cytoskeletal protein [Patescibacteria group bacterium]|nr:polymer-forming cytoskeletal protein [Patescibacteria group bacterium]
MKRAILGVGVVLAAVLPLTSLAAYFNAGKTVNLAAQAVNDNAYVAGGAVTVTSPVTGDLFAAGGTIFDSSRVSQDVMMIGGTVIISGASAQNLRVAGGNVTIGSAISGELVGAGGNFTVTPDTTVAKDSYIAGGAVAWNGHESGNLTIAGGAVVISGTVDGNLKITATKDVTIAQGAVIRGNLDYTAPKPAQIESGAQIAGTTNFHQSAAPAVAVGWLAGIFTLGLLLKFLMTLLVAYVVWYALRRDALAIIEESTKKFGRSLLRGFVFLVAVPIAAIIAFVTVVGAALGGIAGVIYAALALLSLPAAILVVSSLILKRRSDLAWYHILLGAVVLQIAALIPFIGWLACFIVYLASFGGLLAVLGRKFKQQ